MFNMKRQFRDGLPGPGVSTLTVINNGHKTPPLAVEGLETIGITRHG
jgi:hypothetical protein